MGDYVNRLGNIRRIHDMNNVRPGRIRHVIYVNPDEDRNDEQFRKRYRFTREGFTRILDILQDDLPEPTDNRGNPVPPSIKLKAALRFYATGSFQIVAGDLLHISQSSVSQIVAKVSRAIARKRAQLVHSVSWGTSSNGYASEVHGNCRVSSCCWLCGWESCPDTIPKSGKSRALSV